MQIELTEVEVAEILQALNMLSVNRKLISGYTGTQFADSIIQNIRDQCEKSDALDDHIKQTQKILLEEFEELEVK